MYWLSKFNPEIFLYVFEAKTFKIKTKLFLRNLHKTWLQLFETILEVKIFLIYKIFLRDQL